MNKMNMKFTSVLALTFLLCCTLPRFIAAQSWGVITKIADISEVSFSESFLFGSAKTIRGISIGGIYLSSKTKFGKDDNCGLGMGISYSEFRSEVLNDSTGMRGSFRELPVIGLFAYYKTPSNSSKLELVVRGGINLGFASLQNTQISLPSDSVGLRNVYTGSSDTFETGGFLSVGVIIIKNITSIVELSHFRRDFNSIIWSGSSEARVPDDLPLTTDFGGWQISIGTSFRLK